MYGDLAFASAAARAGLSGKTTPKKTSLPTEMELEVVDCVGNTDDFKAQ